MIKQFVMCFLCLLMSIGWALAQTQITGKITNAADGKPVEFASVVVKDKLTVGVMTDLNGVFNLMLPQGSTTLIVSCVGMKTQEVIVGNQKTLHIVMQSESIDMEEVLVVAYGTIKKGSYTGSATQINKEALALRPISNVTQALSGASAGVQISAGSGQPGEGPSIRIRGTNSINGATAPLYIVDGTPYESDISSINSDDIESLTVLKDASSAALYGARAANGVIIITTKRGRKDKMNVNIKLNHGFTMPELPDYKTVNRDAFYVINWEKLRNSYVSSGSTMEEANRNASANIYKELGYNPYNVPNDQIVGTDGKLNPNARFLWADDLDWLGPIRRTGQRNDYSMSISGGNEKTDYYVSIAYLNEQGFTKNSGFKRYGARANVNSKLASWFKTGINLSGTMSEADEQTSTSAGATNPFYVSRFMGPIYPVYKHDPQTGEYLLDDMGNKMFDFGNGINGENVRPYYGNHAIIPETYNCSDRYKRTLLTGKTYGELSYKDFKATINYSVDINNYFGTDYTARFPGEAASPGRVSRTNSQRVTWNFNQLITYMHSFGKHNVDLLAGHEAFSTKFNNLSGDKDNQVADGNDEFINFTTIGSLDSYNTEYNTEGYILRGNYNYDDKYLASASIRWDASSKFHKEVRWGKFWSVGLGWRIDQENFMKPLDFIDNLKLRSSYGQLGNDAGVGTYAWQELYNLRSNASEGGYAATKLGNPNLVWESSDNFDVALEMAFLNRYTVTIEYFHKQSKNMLYSRPLQPSSGFSEIDENAFNMYNKGIELELGADIFRKSKGFSWNLNFNLTHIKNEITDMPVEPYQNVTKRIETGHSMYEFYLKQFYGVDPDNGDALYLAEKANSSTFEKDGVLLTNNISYAKYDYSGSAIPKVYGGITNTFSYRNITLSCVLTYQLGGKMYDDVYQDLMNYTTSTYGRNMHQDIMNRWQKPGDITNVPRLDVENATNQNGDKSTMWLCSSNFLEITSVNLSYKLPSKLTERWGINDVKVYATGDNLCQFNARKGMNVRSSFAGTNSNGYTPARIITIGLNVSF